MSSSITTMRRPVTPYAPGPDDLVPAARAGDAEALGALYDRHAPDLFDTVLRFTGSREDAEDVVHDVFVGLPEALRAYDERGRLGAWLARIAVRRAMMLQRSVRRLREDGIDGAAGIASGDDPSALALRDTENAALHAAVRALPEPLRRVLILRQVEGFSHQEIADVLGISVNNSRTRLARALDALRRALTPDHHA